MILCVGTHSRAHRSDPVDVGLGVYAFGFTDSEPGLRFLSMCKTPMSGWIAPHPTGRFLYSVNETREFDGRPGGGVTAFSVDSGSGALIPLNSRQVEALPCHCEVDATGQFLLVATFGGGSIHVFPILPDGSLGEVRDEHSHVGSSVDPLRQTHPHAHQIVLDPANRFAFVPDLGADKVFAYEFDASSGRLIPRPDLDTTTGAGFGPRHICFNQEGTSAYLINEMNCSITAFSYQAAAGRLSELETHDLLPGGYPGFRSGAEIALHPGRRYLYASTRSHGSSAEPRIRGLDSLVWFEIVPQGGRLGFRGRVPAGGAIPRSFVIDPSGERLYVGHQCTGTIREFRIDQRSGRPVATDNMIETPVPVCLRIVR